jgi:hypothetical protein
MFERFFERDAAGTIKGLTLEWKCPDCAGMKLRVLGQSERGTGEYHTYCRYCKAKFHVTFEKPARPVEGEVDFYLRLNYEDFSPEEKTDMVRDFAEIASLKAEGANPKGIQEKEKVLEAKIDFVKRRRH